MRDSDASFASPRPYPVSRATARRWCLRAFLSLAAPALALGQLISQAPADQAAAPGANATFTVTAGGTGPFSYQWRHNGRDVADANGSTLTIAGVQPHDAGLYTVVVAGGSGSSAASATLGISSTAKALGDATEVAADVRHPLGNTYDQVLLHGPAATIVADPGQITRVSYLDLNDDIVQIEFSGAGALTIVLDAPAGPAPPANYRQPDVSYMKGHAGIVITGADETTNVSVFSVGRTNAVNQALFLDDVAYDGIADLAFIAVQSRDGKFGGLRTANASYFATRGITGLHAPGVDFTGPVYLGDIAAFENAEPVLRVQSAGDLRIAGGDLLQPNGRSVSVASLSPLRFVDGSNSHGTLLRAQANQGALDRGGVDVTAQVVIGAVQPASTLYFAPLRPTASAPTSTASGYAAISIVGADTALVDVNITGLSSAQTSAYLRLAGTDDAILRLPLGQVSERRWDIGRVGIHSRDDIVSALNDGRLYVSLETANHPGGEVAGALVTAAGSQTFSPPAAPPGLPAGALSTPADIDASRLLTQATFGPTTATIADVTRLGIPGWIDAQMKLPASSLLAHLRDDATRFPNPATQPNGQEFPRVDFYFNQHVAWWQLVLTAPDQLRQRVAFALSEIFVIAADDHVRAEPFAHYYDVLAAHAFGNFRALLEQVSVHPEMGWYLTYLRNQKADPVKGTSPDENYAREIQQLFTVGLVQLQPDGTLLLDAEGRPIPTYDNITITETAKVFTGWAYRNKWNSFYSDPAWDGTPGGFSYADFYADTNGRLQPLVCYEAYHDQTEKRVISLEQRPPRAAAPTVIPANQTGPDDLAALLDALFHHPNTGPFVARQLIQRLVTSNPSAGYVYRVGRVFADNGAGVRGDLGAVVTAILTDYEARSPDVRANQGYGKIKEPLLRLSALLRALGTAAPNGRFADTAFQEPRAYAGFWPYGFFGNFQNSTDNLGQAAQHAPSVFNFFSNSYSPPGALADAGLVAPEMQIVDSTLSVKAPNTLTEFVYKEPPEIAHAPSPSPYLRNDLTGLLALSGDPAALLDRIDLLLCAGQMSAATRAVVLETLADIPVVPPLAASAGRAGSAVNISGYNTGLVAPKDAAFDLGNRFTLEGWVFPRAVSGQYSSWLMGKVGDVSGDPWLFYGLTLELDGENKGKVNFVVTDGVPGTHRGITSAAPLPVGQWSHVAAVLDGAAARLYVDGALVAEGTLARTPPPLASAPFSIGNAMRANGDWGWTAFAGCLADVRVWNVARTGAQIAAAMTATPADATGLVAAWRLDEGSGSVAADASGHGRPLRRADTYNAAVKWAPTDGTSLDRVQTALHLTVVSPDAALQK